MTEPTAKELFARLGCILPEGYIPEMHVDSQPTMHMDWNMSPIYHKDFLCSAANKLFDRLSTELAWVRHGTTPRMEYYINTAGTPYTYGAGEFARTYQPQPMHPVVSAIQAFAEQVAGAKFDVCFLNRYINQSDHLGWHSDNSPEMDDARPIAIVSLGVEREIWFRPIGGDQATYKLLLGHGSLCIMPPGYQDTHQHRIPKAGRQCGERISLTFRGYVPLAGSDGQPSK